MNTHHLPTTALRLVPPSTRLVAALKGPAMIDNSDLVLPAHLRDHPSLIRLRAALQAMAPDKECFDLDAMAALRPDAANDRSIDGDPGSAFGR